MGSIYPFLPGEVDCIEPAGVEYTTFMVHNIHAIYDHGVLRPLEPLELPEGARVHLRVEEQVEQRSTDASTDEPPTLLERLKDFVGVAPNLPADASVNLDHYLYGAPKRP